MPTEVHCGGLFLGDTIQEKTRTLLGWSDEVIICFLFFPHWLILNKKFKAYLRENLRKFKFKNNHFSYDFGQFQFLF